MERDEIVVNVVDGDRTEDHIARLEAHGIDTTDAIASGRLCVLTSEETYTRDGKFSATRVYQLLGEVLEDVRSQGRRACLSGKMDWVTRGHRGTEELKEYESRINGYVRTHQCTLLCIYDIDQISGRMMAEILQTHPYIVYGGRINENPYYVAPTDRARDVLLPATPTISRDRTIN
jgi:hypothetical protein